MTREPKHWLRFNLIFIEVFRFLFIKDAYAEPGQDSRNIAGFEVVVIVQDVQDVPPIFTMAPPVTKLPNGLLPGDKVIHTLELRFYLHSICRNAFNSLFDSHSHTAYVFFFLPFTNRLYKFMQRMETKEIHVKSDMASFQKETHLHLFLR